ncbi:hypothetical protein [Leuconostoc citreum]|uniref:hypothetical protein n=1 Tax=Leuconostoc citreum TaxID=33964 RepID=UPI0032DFEDB0
MIAKIIFDNGGTETVNNLVEIIQHKSRYSEAKSFDADNLKTFQPSYSHYTFVGDNIVSVHGSNVHHVTFRPN